MEIERCSKGREIRANKETKRLINRGGGGGRGETQPGLFFKPQIKISFFYWILQFRSSFEEKGNKHLKGFPPQLCI